MRARVALGALLLLASPTKPALAQSQTGFALARLEPAERGSGYVVVDGLDFRRRELPAVGVLVDYAHKPLVAYDLEGNERVAIVRHQLLAHAGASYVLAEWFRLGLDIPFAVYQDGEPAVVGGETLSPATAAAVGDLRLAADARVFGVHGDALTVAVGVRGWLPTGLRSQFTSDGAVRVGPQLLLAGEAGFLAWAARGAFVYRGRDDAYAGAPLGSEVEGAAGVFVRGGRFTIGPEVFGATRLGGEGAGTKSGTPLDVLLGAHVETATGLRFSAAVGTGLTQGFGSPALRALLAVSWSAPALTTSPPDRDGDGIPDEADACRDVAGPPSGDPEENGCPLPERIPDEDTDADGIRDADDACPALAGPRTGDPMTNGCPPDAPKPLAVMTSAEIRIAEQLQFSTGSADLLGESDAVLAAVAKILVEHPEVRRVRVEGHTDDTGNAKLNDDLSRRRASAVVDWLVQHGIDSTRLVSEGYGSTKPMDTNETETGRAKNRRVVFTILERAPRR